jgi:oxygen-independent coproporphyrinogen-3 oxidase
VSYDTVEETFLIDFSAYFAKELAALDELQVQGMVLVNAAVIRVTAKGWFFVRAVAMVFDRYLQGDHNRKKFSKIL